MVSILSIGQSEAVVAAVELERDFPYHWHSLALGIDR